MKPLHFVLTFFCLLFICSVTSAQNNGYYHSLKTATSGNSGTGANIDVVYHRLSLAISPEDATKTLTGSTVTYFKTTVSAVNNLSFDLSKTSFNNTNLSVFYHGISCSYSFPTTGNTNILNITLPSSIANIKTLDSITINYKGTPASPSGQKLGLARSYDNAGNYYIFTLSESYEDRNWWPCKADMQDKIDSLDIICTVPSAYWVAANGLMTDSSIVGSNRVFTFKHSYPIASYLVAFAAAKYKKIYLGNVTVGSKNVPFVANIFPDKTTTTENTIINYLNSNKQVFSTFNTLYGNYPFANEKHGFYEFGFGGGMEHQTFSGLDASSFQSHSVMAHELAHQWFGDKVTMATWNHLWLAEGFATYSETVAAEKIPSLGLNYASLLLSSKTSARANTSTSIYLTSIANSDSVWSSKNVTAVYDRGCMVASMLRCLLGENKFFTACKNYLSDTNLQYKSATTSDLQLHMETQFGESMNDFFNEWIMKKGTPNYTVSWAKQTKYIVLGLTQSVTSSGTTGTASTFFPMPVVIKIADTINHLDTTVIIYHKSANVLMTSGDGVGTTYNSNFIGYNLSFTPNKVIFDSLNQTMANATIIYNASLPLYSLELKNTSTKNGNNLTTLISTDELVDAVELWKSTSGNDFVSIGNMTLQNKNATSFHFGFIDKHITSSCFYKAVFHTKNCLIVYSKIIFVDSKQNNVLVYPNPAKTFFSIQLKQLSNKTFYKLYDASGKLVDTKTILEMATQISTSHLTNGIYWLEIEMNDNIISAQKIIVEK